MSKPKATIQQRIDALRQLRELFENDCDDVVLSILTDKQIINLAEDFIEGKD